MGAALHLRVPPALKTGPRFTALQPADHNITTRTTDTPTVDRPKGSGTIASVSCQSSIDRGDYPSTQEYARASNKYEPKQKRREKKQETQEGKQGLKQVIQKLGQHNG